MRPRVVIDIATLGYAQQHPTNARGLHRVAQHTVLGLLEADECDLHFVATSSLAGAYDWLKERGLDPATMLSWRRSQLWLSRLAERASRWIARTLPDRRLRMKATRWILQRIAVAADSRSARLPTSALRGANIYHSPLAPIPLEVRRRKDIQKFLTVVDVIPLTNPDTVGGKGVPLLRKQLGSLTPPSFAFCISETVKDELLSVCDLTSERVFVTPLAASKLKFYPVRDDALIDAILAKHSIGSQPYFLTLSSFDPRKNFAHVIRCFAQLVNADEVAGCNLVIVGSNPERNSEVDLALKEFPALRGRIITPGFVPDEDLAAVYSGALAFLFPSLSEGFGIPLLEAMQCGAPVISSNASAMPEVAGDAAILLDPHDVEGWGAALRNVASDAILRGKMAEQSLARSREFSWIKFTQATLAGYRAALGA